MSTTKRIVLVTGGNAGIGLALCKLIASKGHKVWLAARNPVAGEEAAAKLRQENLDVKTVKLDVTDLSTIVAAKELIEKEDGKLDVLVNNAGIGDLDKDQNALTVDLQLIRRAFETNFYGMIQTTQTFVPIIRKAASAAGHAVILNVASDMASNSHQAKPDSQLHFVAYNTSKAAANSYTIALSHELRQHNIKVNAVSPGYTSTKLNFFGQDGKDVVSGAQCLFPWALLENDGQTGQFMSDFGSEW
ncbi:hypothetical protein AGABI1DRAFT_128650 [Agaricus bisporus var. burnettii JB137-S8]|uniref:NAD(P)-binding protein n=1 Tax=Agaricus bisporus var. burnettii (strain JB137-S8 / ATCC MYA-4627 / FGSC 10392) TaxID=597362 RepID=K5X8E9_AGABU|nr:uncharacterized protein AGABI1DRAFT_128650 [Agaricus bisporus var. burnettii JB137-S8]EKM79498.1 hypothetical protein AGABI1DRAFT_128650 [Agaricus bisporus var. burnettii JB137-S8]